MYHTCLNSSNVPASFANDLQSTEELYFGRDREQISGNDETNSSLSDDDLVPDDEDSDSHNNQAELDATIEWREYDIIEHQKVESFLKEGCGCSYEAEERNCSNRYSLEQVLNHRQVCLEMSSSELDMVVLAQLEACTRQDELSHSSRQTKKRKRNRT